jgi:hypothetical protein
LLERYFYGRVWSCYIIMLISLVAATGWYYAGVFNGLTGALAQFQSSIGGALLLAPFDVFAHIFLAQSNFPDLLLWATLGLAINMGILTVVILLDRQSCEASTAASLELHKRWVARAVVVCSGARNP